MTSTPGDSLDPSLQAMADAVARLREILDLRRPLRILVLFDPDALLCRELGALGHDVECCPDLQCGWEESAVHVSVVAESTERLVTVGDHWDLIVGSRGWDRYLAVHAPERTRQFMAWVRQQSTAAIFDCPRKSLAPDLNQQGPYRVRELFGDFRLFGEVACCDESENAYRAPLIVMSNHYLVSSSFWVAASDLDEVEGDRTWREADSQVRTFTTSDARVVKVEATTEEYLERSQAAGEALFLQSVDSHVQGALSLPRVLHFDRGLSVVCLVRERIPGAPLSSVEGTEAVVILREVLNEAARFAEHGLFPNDLRPWNILWDGHTCRFIDFADTSACDDDVQGLPQVVALAGTLALAVGPGNHSREEFPALVTQWAGECGIGSADLYDDAWRGLPGLAVRCRFDPSLAGRALFESVMKQALESVPDRGIRR